MAFTFDSSALDDAFADIDLDGAFDDVNDAFGDLNDLAGDFVDTGASAWSSFGGGFDFASIAGPLGGQGTFIEYVISNVLNLLMGSILVYKIAYVWLMGGKSKNMAFRFAQYEVKALLGKMAGCGAMYPMLFGLWVIAAFALILCGWSGIGNGLGGYVIMTPSDLTLEVCVCTGLAMCWKIFASIAVYRIALGHTYWRLNAILATVFLGLFLWRLLRFVPMYSQY